MDERTCSVESCETPIGRSGAKGMCPPHYNASRPPCTVDDCFSAQRGRGLCAKHYWRLRKYGDPTVKTKGDNNDPCSVEGCETPSRKRGWCGSHYSVWYTSRQEPTPFRYTWGPEGSACPVCGDTCPGRRGFCSMACAALSRRYKGVVPDGAECVLCLSRIDLTERGRAGRRRRSEVRICRSCRSTGKRNAMTVGQLALRDGTDCSICGDPVDMALTRPASLFGPSVDHVIPRALGGVVTSENEALAHYWCNAVKSDRAGYSLRT